MSVEELAELRKPRRAPLCEVERGLRSAHARRERGRLRRRLRGRLLLRLFLELRRLEARHLLLVPMDQCVGRLDLCGALHQHAPPLLRQLEDNPKAGLCRALVVE